MGYILHIDTSSETAIIALARRGELLGEKRNEIARDHAAAINLLIAALLEEHNTSLAAMDAFAVVGGPGSYTGLRIGLATAKAFCYALQKPLILMNKLDLLAAQQLQLHEKTYKYYAAVLAARQGEYFACVMKNDGEHLLHPQHMLEEDLHKALTSAGGNMLLSGTFHIAAPNITLVDNSVIDLGSWMKEGWQDFQVGNWANLATAEPFYLKQVYTNTKV